MAENVKFPLTVMRSDVGPDTPILINTSTLEALITQILNKSNKQTLKRIVNEVNDSSDVYHVPSALAVFNLLKAIKPGMECITVLGDINSVVVNPDSHMLYLQKDSLEDETWTIYLYIENKFIAIGDTNIDLVNYWSKSEADIAILRNKILSDSGAEEFLESLDLENVLKDDTTSKNIVLNWLEGAAEQILAALKDTDVSDLLTEEQLGDITDHVIEEADKKYVQQTEVESKITEVGDERYLKIEDFNSKFTTISTEEIKSLVETAAGKIDPDEVE